MSRNKIFLSRCKSEIFKKFKLNNNFKSKKGDIQISLSWLFMIIIGTFFIYTAYSIIGTYSENEETKYYIEVKSALSNVLIKAGQTIGYEENYIQPIDTFFKDSKVEIICNEGLPLLFINDKIDDNVDFLKNVPSFMTTIEEGSVSFTYLAVENFRAPFKVTNMMGIVSKKNLIVFDSNSDVTSILREKFSESSYKNSLNYVEIDFSSIDSSTYNDLILKENLKSIMFVSDNGVSFGGGFDLDELSIDSYHLQVSGGGVDFKYGELKYTDRALEESIFSYVDFRDDVFNSKPLAMITMAVFSRPSTYECGQNLVIESTKSIFDFYINKAKYLEKVAEDVQVCSNELVYGSISDGTFDGTYQVERYKLVRTKIEKGRDQIVMDRFNNPNNLYDIIEEIQDLSQELSDESCEMIY
jgi:hypothetical protein